MGYGLMPYTVDIDRLREVRGSGDDKIRRMIHGRFRAGIERLDEQFDWEGEGDGPTSTESVAAARAPLGAVTDPSKHVVQVRDRVETAVERGEGIVGFHH